MFAVWSSHRNLAPLLAIHDARILPNVFALLSASTAAASVVSRVHDLVEDLLNLKEQEEVI